MNFDKLIADVADKTFVSREIVGSVIRSMFKSMSADLEHQGVVGIPNFGIFSTAGRDAREGRNPRTGESVHIPPQRVAKFRPSKALKDRLNGKVVVVK